MKRKQGRKIVEVRQRGKKERDKEMRVNKRENYRKPYIRLKRGSEAEIERKPDSDEGKGVRQS